MKKVLMRPLRNQIIRSLVRKYNQTIRIEITAVSENTLGE